MIPRLATPFAGYPQKGKMAYGRSEAQTIRQPRDRENLSRPVCSGSRRSASIAAPSSAGAGPTASGEGCNKDSELAGSDLFRTRKARAPGWTPGLCPYEGDVFARLEILSSIQASTSSATQATRQAPSRTRVGNWLAASSRAICAKEYGTP